MWWLLFVVPFACGGFSLWCLLRALRACVHGVALSLHGAPRIQSCTQHWKTELQFSGRDVQICFGFFFLCCIQLSTTSRKFTPLSYPLLHLFWYYFRGALALLSCFGVASALLLRCFGVASALLRRCFGVLSAFLGLLRCFGGVRCNFGATSVQLGLNLGSTMRSAQPKPHGQLLGCSFV